MKRIVFYLILSIAPFIYAQSAQKQAIAVQQFSKADVLIVEEQHTLLPVVAPVIAKLSSSKATDLLVMSAPVSKQQIQFLKNLGTKIALIKHTQKFSQTNLKRLLSKTVTVSPDVEFASITIARKFWKQSPQIVVALGNEMESVIYAATLAAHKKSPFIPLLGSNYEEIPQLVKDLQVTEVIVVAEGSLPEWVQELPLPKKVMNIAKVQKLFKKLENQNNLLLSHILKQHWGSKSAWMLPYFSFIKKAPIFLSSSSDGKEVEKEVSNFIHTLKMQPKYLTILADYNAISPITIRNPEILEEYEVEVEPCSVPSQEFVSSLAVGRIPLVSLHDLSMLMARIKNRKRLLKDQTNRVVMTANPNPEFGDLPMAQTISQATAEEFKNLQIAIDEFYQITTTEDVVIEATEKSHLLIFEGHVSDQYIFASSRNTEEDELDFAPPPPPPVRNLQGQAFVILQSCYSLEEVTAQSIFDSGGVGFVGSVTAIHSASGSAFIKAFSDNILYDNCSVGEALLDAKNYFFCLAKLRKFRGHKEVAKLIRVAMSFRLWGDPEMYILPQEIAKPIRSFVKAKFTKKNKIVITTPARTMKTSTPQYFVKMLPRSKLAGLVKRLKNKEERRLMLFYFFKLPLPEGFEAKKYRILFNEEDVEEVQARATFMVDHYQKNIYVLYFPEKTETKDKITLKFSKN